MVSGVLLIAANAFFVAIEFALTRLRQFEKSELPDTPGARRSWELTEELEINLTGCQVGISLTSILLGVVAEPAITKVLTPVFTAVGVPAESSSTVAVVTGIVLMNLIHKIWGEQSPTYLGVERPLEVCTYLGVPFSWWIKVCYPVILFGDGLAKWTLSLVGVEVTRSWTEDSNEEETGPRANLRESLISVLKEGGVRKDRRREVARALEIGKIPLGEIMVARKDVVSLKTGAPLGENLRRVRESCHSRYPLVEDDLDSFLGAVYVPEMLGRIEELRAGELELRELIHGKLRMKEDTTISDAIDRLQEACQEVAVVTDDGGEAVGLVTLTDTLEAIVGEAKDPLDD